MGSSSLDATMYSRQMYSVAPQPGSVVWLPDEVEIQGKKENFAYIPVKIVKLIAQKNLVECENLMEMEPNSGNTNKTFCCRLELLQYALDLDMKELNYDFSDMIRMNCLNEATILSNLRKRFKHARVYTAVDDILVFVNPFHKLKIYSEITRQEYLQSNSLFEKPPHIYKSVERACREMLRHGKHQCFLISGESGAGKTESVKLILEYVVERDRSTETRPVDHLIIDEQLLQSTPLLEAFGNAKTCRNINSSRFGKWLQVSFKQGKKKFEVVGGLINSYLLETPRVCHQVVGESNFHIFYQLLYAASSEMLGADLYNSIALGGEVKDYEYLCDENIDESLDYANDWKLTSFALDALMTYEEKAEVVRLVVAILHLGNIKFSADTNGYVKICDNNSLSLAANLLKMSEARLQQVLTSKSLGNSRETILSPYSQAQAITTRNAMAKGIYGRLFDWIVSKVNHNINLRYPPESGSVVQLGLLDIFGFENFHRNSFEQLCINFCNEKMHALFNKFIFDKEIQVCEREGLALDPGKVSYRSNLDIINLIESRENESPGILTIMDDLVLVRRNDEKDEQLLTMLVNTHGHGKTSSFKEKNRTKDGEGEFEIIHFAGNVTYQINGLIEKNKDTLQDDITEACAVFSSSQFLNGLFSEELKISKSTSSRSKMRTFGIKFRNDLTKLLSNISESEPSFVRCIKSNEYSNPDTFESSYVLKQLRFTGIADVCRIRQCAFPIRLSFTNFLTQYMCLLPLEEQKSIRRQETLKSQCELLCSRIRESQLLNETFLGNTKIFLRKEDVEKLEMMKNEVRLQKAEKIQTLLVRVLNKLRGYKLKSCILELKNAVDQRDVIKIDHCINVLEKININSSRIDEMKDEARNVQKQVAFETKEKENLFKAVEEGDVKKVDALCKSLRELATKLGDHNLTDRLEIEQARRLVKERSGVFILKNAISSGCLLTLYDALGDLKYSHHSYYRDAQMKCIELEYDMMEELKLLGNNNRISGITTLLEVEDTSNEVDRICNLLIKSPITSTVKFVIDMKEKISTRLRGKRMVFYIKFLHMSLRNRDPAGIEKYSTLLFDLDETSDAITQLLIHAGELKRRCEEENALKIRLDKALENGDYSEAEKICDYIDMRSNKLNDKNIRKRLNLFEARAQIMELKTKKREIKNIASSEIGDSSDSLRSLNSRFLESDDVNSDIPMVKNSENTDITELPEANEMTVHYNMVKKRVSSSTNDGVHKVSSAIVGRSPRNNMVTNISIPQENYDSAQNLISALVLKADLNSRMRQARYRMENKTKPQEQLIPTETKDIRQTRKRKGRCAIS